MRPKVLNKLQNTSHMKFWCYWWNWVWKRLRRLFVCLGACQKRDFDYLDENGIWRGTCCCRHRSGYWMLVWCILDVLKFCSQGSLLVEKPNSSYWKRRFSTSCFSLVLMSVGIFSTSMCPILSPMLFDEFNSSSSEWSHFLVWAKTTSKNCVINA